MADVAQCMVLTTSGERCGVRTSVAETALFHGGRYGVPAQCLPWPLCRKHRASLLKNADGIRMYDGLFWRIEMGRKQAQQVSSASNRVLIAMLAYKMFGAEEVPEPYSSQTCPGCGCRQRCRRVYKCRQCGLTAARDVIGCTNIRRIAVPDTPVPKRIEWTRPLRKYPVAPQRAAGSSGGTPARTRAT